MATRPFRAQKVRTVEELASGSLIEDEARHLLQELCADWGHGRFHLPSERKVVTVVARRGLRVWTPVEWTWAME